MTLSTLTEYKRIDLAVRAFTASGRPLIVIGDGPDRGRLERLAGPSVRFAGHLGDAARAELLAAAQALVFPGEEDFGIAAVEALACGTPVVAYGRGGLTEIVADGRTGVFFDEESTGGAERRGRAPGRAPDPARRADGVGRSLRGTALPGGGPRLRRRRRWPPIVPGRRGVARHR